MKENRSGYIVNDSSKEKLIKDDKRSDADTATLKEEVPNVSFVTLFRFASTMDKLYIFLAIISSIICGCTTPIITLLFSSFLQSMVTYGKSNADNNPQPDVFLRDVRNFAIYNAVLGAVIIILSYVATVLMNISAFNQVYRIRQEYLKAALNQDFQYFDTHQTGDFAGKMTNDVVKLEDGIGEKLATFIFYQTSFISSIIMALSKGLKFALLCLILFPVSLFLVRTVGRIVSRLSKEESIALGKAGSLAEEVLSSIRTVYAFSGQQKEIERYEKYLTEARGINIKKGFFNGMAMGTLFFCIFGAYALSFWFGYKLMVEEPEIYDVKTMIAVIFGVIMGSTNFSMSLTLMEVFGNACEAGAQIFNLINNIPLINPLLNIGIAPKIEGNIELKNVVFQYPSRPDVTVLKGVNLSVQRGQSVALVGHSGCGKSTIIQLISRFYEVVDGGVHIDGHDVREVSVRWLRAHISLVSHELVMFNTTIRENIRYGREDASDEDIEIVAQQANAHKFIMKLPSGYDTLVGERGASLSGGQKQRIAIARALVRNPQILLLDEATSALDTSSEAKVQKALDKAREGRTTIVVAHRLSTIRNVDKIYVFKSGNVVESGNHDELMTKKGHYYDMIMLQASPDINETDQENKLKRTVSVINKKHEHELTETKFQENAKTIDDPKISLFQVMKWNAPEWKTFTAASICSFVSGFAMPVLAVILGDLIGILSNPDRDVVTAQVLRYSLLILGVGIFSAITNFVTVCMYCVAGECLTARLRKQLFKKMLQQEVGFYDDRNNSTGALCARISGETAAVQGVTGQRIGTFLQAVGTFSFALGVSLYYEQRLVLVALAFISFMAAVLYKQYKMVTAESFENAKTMESSSKIAVEAIANVRTVASLGCEQSLLNDYANQLLNAHEIEKRSSNWRGIVFGLSRGLFNFMYAAILYYGSNLIVYDRVGYDIILSSAQVLFIGSSSAAQALSFAPNLQKGIKAAGRVIAILGRDSKIIDPVIPAIDNFVSEIANTNNYYFNKKGTGEASIQNVQFKYPTRPLIQVLQNFSLEIENGKTIALVGSSGCGKSTIIQLLERYYDPDEGVVAQNGIPLSKLRLVDVRQSIGFVQQDPILFDRTIGENIAYGDNSRKPTMDEIVEAAKQANIHSFVVSLPMGYETNIGSKGSQLSGGQKQRVAIARALIRRPKMLLLDEATSALDTESEKAVQAALDAAKAGRTCVMIAHRLSTIREADIIYVLDNGRIAERGTHSELVKLKGLYYNLNKRGYT